MEYYLSSGFHSRYMPINWGPFWPYTQSILFVSNKYSLILQDDLSVCHFSNKVNGYVLTATLDTSIIFPYSPKSRILSN